VWRENAVRRHIDQGQKAAIAIDFVHGSEAWITEREAAAVKANEARSEAAKAQPRADGKLASPIFLTQLRAGIPVEAGGGPAGPPPAVRSEDRHEERTKLADISGVSPRTVARVLSIQAKSPEQFERVKRGEVTVSKALADNRLRTH